MTVIARRFRSIPERSALDTWCAISELLAAQDGSSSRRELESVEGVASSLITREAMKRSAILVYGSGPRVRVYCLYQEDAITGDDANEQPLGFDATSGDWHLSLPCTAEDLEWVQAALKKKTVRITARDLTVEVEESSKQGNKATRMQVNKEAFFRS